MVVPSSNGSMRFVLGCLKLLCIWVNQAGGTTYVQDVSGAHSNREGGHVVVVLDFGQAMQAAIT